MEKRITSPLMEPSSIEKIVEIDSHIGEQKEMSFGRALGAGLEVWIRLYLLGVSEAAFWGWSLPCRQLCRPSQSTPAPGHWFSRL